ncbi:MAG: SLATT domain-containing protein [Pseudomonadota bacterium]
MTDPERSERWQDARRVIGDQAAGDYLLDLEDHAARYDGEAPGLSDILRSAAARAHGDAFLRYDADAIEAQQDYFRWMRRTNIGTLLTSVFGASAMAWQLVVSDAVLATSWLLPHVSTALAAAATAAAGLGAAGLYFLRNGKLLETWMTRRAQAETQRIAYFETVIDKAGKQSTWLHLLTLEYFLRYQFEVQKNYYATRSREHRVSAGKTVTIGAAGAVIATVSSASGVTLQGAANWPAAIAVIGAAIGAFAVGREQMTQDRRNSERYERISATLTDLSRTLDDVRAQTERGNAAGVAEFARAVNEQISNEHRQWLDQADAMRSALDRIEKALAARGALEPSTPQGGGGAAG